MAGTGSGDQVPGSWPLPLGHRGGGGAEAHHCLRPGARPAGGLGKSSGALRNGAPAGPRLGELESPGEKLRATSYLTFHQKTTTRADGWWNAPTNGSLLTVVCGRGHCGTNQ